MSFVPASWSVLRSQFVSSKCLVRFKSSRWSLGKSPEVAKNLEQRLAELNYKDPSVYYKVDIGLPQHKLKRKDVLKDHVAILKANKSNSKLEKLSRNNELKISLEEVEQEWIKSVGPLHIKDAAEHYGIFEHLFGDAYFIPAVPLDITYSTGSDHVSPVYRGNVLTPTDATTVPTVKFDAPPDSLWTLVLTTPDGHLNTEDGEYLHWFVGNIKGNNIESGEALMDYIQPFPLKGTGYYRYVFVLYKQDKPIDYSALKKPLPCTDLKERTWNTLEFYRDRQDYLTPAGLAFFQASFDESVRSLFHSKFNCDAPVFEYDFPEHYYSKQKWFPKGQAFNLYLDRYRDEKQIAKEYLAAKLKSYNPFSGYPPKLQFPNAVPFKKGVPSWLKHKLKKDRVGLGRVKDY